jgi:outer membrane protein TolC
MKTFNQLNPKQNPAVRFTKLMKLASVMLALISVSHLGFAQQRNPKDSLLEERLVDLAMKGPMMQIADHQAKIDQYELKSRQNAWLNLLTLSANYNDLSLRDNPNQTFVFPRYLFGVTVPLGTLLSRTEVKAARESVEIGKLNKEQLRRTLRTEVLAKYRQYKAHTDLINLQSELVSDVETGLTQTEDKFRKGAVSLEVYSAAQKIRNDERARLVNLRLQQDMIKLDIERIIGQPLETVMR